MRYHYCTIIEVHSPQYLDEQWLQALFPDQFPHFQKSSQEVDTLLYLLNELISHFPITEEYHKDK